MKREDNPALYDWLERHWRFDNHRKYQHYFTPWVENITDWQIQCFLWQKDHEERQAMVQH